LKKGLKNEKSFMAVQLGQNAILLCGINQPAKNAQSAARF